MTTETKNKTISFSEISCYQTCSLKHRLRYIEKIESEYVDQALILGSCCHSAIEACLKKYQATDKVMNVIELQQIFTDIMKYQAREKKIRYKDGWKFEHLNRMGCNMLNFWLRSFRRNCGAIISMEVEKTFVVPLPDPETGESTNYAVKGVIDLLAHMKTIFLHSYEPDELTDRFFGKHQYAIVDWKTYLNKPNKVSMERSIQNAIYTWGAYQAGLIPDIKRTASFMGVLHKKKTPTFQTYQTPVTENLIRQALKLFNDTILAIELGFAMPNFNPIHCSYCEYYDNLCQTEY